MQQPQVPWKETRYPGVAIRFLRLDAESGDVTALIRMAPESSYPPHRHNPDYARGHASTTRNFPWRKEFGPFLGIDPGNRMFWARDRRRG